MLATRVLRTAFYKNARVWMSTTSETSTSERKLEHYKNLSSLQENTSKPADWDDAKPFDSLPGPKPIPVFGNKLRFGLPVFGEYAHLDFKEAQEKLHEQYGNIYVIKELLSFPLVMLYDPKDMEKFFRNEGFWPIRRELPSVEHYRKSREGFIYKFGLTANHGEKWFKIRTTVNPVLMQPRNIAQYTEKMDEVAQDLVDNMSYMAKQDPNGEMPKHFINELYKWALESVGLVTFDARLGCLKRDLAPDSQAQKMINNALKIFELMLTLDMSGGLYRYFNTPGWKTFSSSLDYLISTNTKLVNEALEKLEKEELDNENETKSILQQMLKKDKTIAFGMASDLLLAGIDTTGRTLGAGIYFLARYPEIQEEFRKELKSLLPNKDSCVTKEVLSNSRYLQAILKEITRIAPIAIGNLRTTVKDLVLGGYQIPKGTDVFAMNLILCHKDEYFPRAREFLPQRWLPNAPEEITPKNTNPFIIAPFGYGPRSCIGKRLATLELQTALVKIIRNFDLSWHHEDMVFKTTTVYGVGAPLRVRVKEI